MRNGKKYYQVIILAMFLILVGILLIYSKSEAIINSICTILGILIILENLPVFFDGMLTYNRGLKEKANLTTSIFSLILGFMMIFWHNQIFLIIAAILLIILPIVRVLISKDKKGQFNKEIIRIVLGVIILIFGPWNLIDIVFDIIGILLIVIGVLLIIYSFIYNKPKNSNNNNNSIPKHDSDNTIDAEIKVLK